MYSEEEILDFLRGSIEGRFSVEEQVEFLRNFTIDKVRAEDLATYVKFMEENMSEELEMPGAIDICGTGGSGLMRINTSTIATFILAKLGVGVAKHGNKAASGRFGSFDLLEALGENIEMSKEELEESYAKKKYAYIYARKFHPLMRHFVEARKAISEPTIFNLLGPLLNPARPLRQIIGTSFKEQMRLIAESCKLLGKEHVLVVRGNDGLDEVTLCGETEVVELKGGEISSYKISPEDFGIEPVKDFSEIAGGDREFNLAIAKSILARECSTRHADLVYLNVALALKFVGKVDDLESAYLMAKGNILQAIARSKKIPNSTRDFYGALSQDALSIIAEIKKASPSEGLISQNFDPCICAEIYDEAGASAISVLTDKRFFQGDFQYLDDVRSMTDDIPLLCKDFIVSEYQIYKARDFGADAILLIAALLSMDQMQRYIDIARELGMDVLCEIHNEEELEKVLLTDARIIGINNRDLETFEIDLETTNRLIKKIPEGRIIVSESGFSTAEDVRKLDPRVDAILVGTSLMKAKNIKEKIYEFKSAANR